jgi:methyl-accepting chemotaxis protein
MNAMFKMSFAKKIMSGSALAVMIPMLVIGSFVIFQMQSTLTATSEDMAMQTVDSLTGLVRIMVEKEISEARALSSLNNVTKAQAKVTKDGRDSAKEDISELNKELYGILKQLGDQYVGVFITDANGLSFAGAKIDGDFSAYQKMDVSDRDYFKGAKADGKANVGSIVKGKTAGQAVMIVSAPVKSEKGEFLGILGLASKIDALTGLIGKAKVGRSGYAFMTDEKGTVIAHPRQDLILELNIAKQKGTEALAQKMINQERGHAAYSFEGKEKFAFFTPVGVRSWSIGAVHPKEEFIAATQRLTRLSILIGGILLTIALCLTFLFSRSISGPVTRAVAGLSMGSTRLTESASHISNASQQMAEGASEQAASIEETSSSLEEMSSMTRQNAENAVHANQLMTATKQTVTQAGESMKQLTTSMSEISQASEDTSKIIKTIDEIAFQTNLLALNAAVEAARAGEAGAGFAVVADEVRNLAMRAADAAKNTAELIESTVTKVKQGSEVVEKTEREFRDVAVSVTKSGELIGEISAASREQAQGIEQVSKAVNAMDKVVQQNAANAEESASASEDMNSQAVEMKEFITGLMDLIGGVSTPTRESTPGSDGMIHKIKRATKETRPEHVIPFDEKDLEDF